MVKMKIKIESPDKKPEKTEKKKEKPEKKKELTIKDISEKAQEELRQITGFRSESMTSIKKEETGWLMTIELLEKEGIPDRTDILGLYEVKVDGKGNLTSYERRALRKRGDVTEQMSEEE